MNNPVLITAHRRRHVNASPHNLVPLLPPFAFGSLAIIIHIDRHFSRISTYQKHAADRESFRPFSFFHSTLFFFLCFTHASPKFLNTFYAIDNCQLYIKWRVLYAYSIILPYRILNYNSAKYLYLVTRKINLINNLHRNKNYYSRKIVYKHS